MLCLNMIVKNEMANLERCLAAVADHIGCWVIGDTGSTDGTQDFIVTFLCRAQSCPGELHSFPFQNFEQARNAALDCAYASPLAYDYLLFADADMELVVEDPGFRERLDGAGLSVAAAHGRAAQLIGTRASSGATPARAITASPTNISTCPAMSASSAGFGTRTTPAARTGSTNSSATSDCCWRASSRSRRITATGSTWRNPTATPDGRPKAAEAYAKRAEMGGWDEEAWYARLQEARCLRNLGDEGGFLRRRWRRSTSARSAPSRSTTWRASTARSGMNEASVLFSEPGWRCTRPEQDILFLEDFVYTAGLKEEFSIAANYARDPARKDRGFAACNWLALNRECAGRAARFSRGRTCSSISSPPPR